MFLRKDQFQVLKELLATDLYILKGTVRDQVINLCIWMISMTVVNSYLMPAFGLSLEYSAFILAGLCASAGLFGIFPSVANLVSDFKGDQVYTYYLTLPLPSWMIFLRLIFYYALNFSLLGILVLPIGQLLIWDRFSLRHVAFGKFFLIFTLSYFFYGAFTLWIASRVPDMTKIGNVWMRFVYPIWFLGCFQFSWAVLREKSQLFSFINLMNPITYIMEGMRAAVLGQNGYLNFWICCLMIAFFGILCSWRAIVLLKRRLDFV
ncbi:ABC transporter permease [Candidatus Dependentiae bacterium]|nr:ABC transporter permease [Candidatus Dependentiae bacterium]